MHFIEIDIIIHICLKGEEASFTTIIYIYVYIYIYIYDDHCQIGGRGGISATDLTSKCMREQNSKQSEDHGKLLMPHIFIDEMSLM